MNTTTAVRTGLTLALVSMTLLGAGMPSQVANAATNQQMGTESWGTFRVPPPEHAHVVMSSSPPAMGPEQLTRQNRAAASSRLPGPTTPAGAESTTRSPTVAVPETDLAANGTSAPGTFTIFKNSSLAAGTSRYEINEPSAANNGRDIFATYNYYAGLSTDYGNSWTYVDPATSFAGLHGGFCCDQDVINDPGHGLTIWELLYAPDVSGNSVRLAVANGQAALEAGTWYSYVITSPESYCSGGVLGDFFDFPQLVVTNNYLYLVTNIFTSGSVFRCTTVIRLSLAEIAAAGGLTVGTYYSSTGFNFAAAQGGTDTLFFARHEDTTHLRVYTWPESVNGSGVTSALIAHAAYLTSVTYNCTVTGFTNPCGHEDDRVTTGWLRRSNNELGFMWDAPQGTDGKGTFPYPYTRIVTMDATTKGSVHDTYIWSSATGLFLASSGVNARGHVGGTLAFGGGALAPNCAAWLYDDYTAFDTPEVMLATSGTDAPSANRWGDYLRTRPDGLNPFEWQGTCYAIESGTVTPRVVRFGRARDDYLTAGMYDDANGWNYTGSWAAVPVPGAFNNTLHIGVAQGSAAWLSFNAVSGTRFYMTYLTYPGWGTIEVYLDSNVTPLAILNTNGPAGLPIYQSPVLTAGPHTVKLRQTGPSGTWVGVDAMEAGVNKYDDGDAGWSYTGAWGAPPIPGTYNNTLHIAVLQGSQASFPFNGSRFALIYLNYPGWGNIGVFLDSNPTPIAVLNTSAPAALPTYTSPVLATGAHTVTLAHLGPPGSMIAIDAITITP